jgi:uncharacterized protein DUF6893
MNRMSRMSRMSRTSRTRWRPASGNRRRHDVKGDDTVRSRWLLLAAAAMLGLAWKELPAMRRYLRIERM